MPGESKSINKPKSCKDIKKKKVSVYKKQALVIINLGEAKGIDIFNFSQKIKKTVNEKFNILLEEEVNII